MVEWLDRFKIVNSEYIAAYLLCITYITILFFVHIVLNIIHLFKNLKLLNFRILLTKKNEIHLFCAQIKIMEKNNIY